MTDDLVPVVDPREVPVRNAWYLLLYAWDLAQWRDRWAGAVEQGPQLRGLLARVLVDCTNQLLKRQLGRSYTRVTAEIRGIRGRIDLARSIKGLSFEAGKAVCSYPELTTDTLRNRILRSTLDQLARSTLLRAGASDDASVLLRHELRRLVRAMDGVKLQAVQSADFGKLQLGRNDRDYFLPLSICRLLYEHDIPTEESGNAVFAGLARDEITFHALFERFVRNFYRFHRPDARVEAQELSWFDENGCTFVPRMKTDITLEWDEPVARRLVIDTKYYGSALSVRYAGVEKFHSANLYQMYAYLRTQEHRGPTYLNANGVLLYPVTNRRLDERMHVQGHEIRVRTVNLAGPWEEVESELLGLVEPVIH